MTRTLSLLVFAFSLTSRPCAADRSRFHDGLYLRLAAGPTQLIDPVTVEAPGVEYDGNVTGFGFTFDVALGGSPSPGLVLGGGAFIHAVSRPEVDDMKATIAGAFDLNGDVEFDGMSFTLLGGVIDYYPDPSEGLHLNAALGIALLSMGEGTVRNVAIDPFFQDHGAAGFGALVGVGYEWWVSNTFSLGAMARIAYGAPAGDEDDVEWQHHVWAPAVLFTATMN
jgi:hypothetical protein